MFGDFLANLLAPGIRIPLGVLRECDQVRRINSKKDVYTLKRVPSTIEPSLPLGANGIERCLSLGEEPYFAMAHEEQVIFQSK